MSADIIIRLILGHIVGDYLFQNNWMAFGKKSNILPCIVHCLIYTFSVCAFVYPEIIVQSSIMIINIIVFVYFSHIILDGTHLVDNYLHLIKGRSWKSTKELAYKQFHNYEMSIVVSYTVLVQTAVDNGLHLIMLYFIFRFML